MATSDITLFTEANPGIYSLAKLYKPNDSTSTGNVVPKVDSIIVDEDNNFNLYTVIAVNADTLESTLKRTNIIVTTEDDSAELTSILSYKNDIIFVYFDKRTTPMQITPDTKIVVYGKSNTQYRLIRYPDTDHEEVISLYYDTDGKFYGNLIPLLDTNTTKDGKYFSNCHTKANLTDGEELRIEVFNAYGAETATFSRVFAKQSTILNEDISYSPVITGISITSSQMRSNNEIYIFEKQDINSLNLSVILHYDDGVDRSVDIDGNKCRIYGLEDFVSSYSGLKQPLVAKYYLDSSETTSVMNNESIATHLSAEASLIVVPNKLAAGIKISVLPRWNAGANKYVLFYYLYSLDRDVSIDVTPYVTIDDSTEFNPTLYGQDQLLTLSIDMSKVDPETYTSATIYKQNVILKLQPYAALERYIIKDTSNGSIAYGVDNSYNRRPVLHYDTTLQQYFIPSLTFENKEAVINSFYTMASPPFDINTETSAPTPTHFIIRDINTGNVLTQSQISLDDFVNAFSITGANPDRYVGTNVIVEFLKYVNETQSLILYGVPVDCYTSASGYRSI